MPSLSFQKRFCTRVEAGEKTHSIRPKRKHPEQWMPGRYVHLFFAMRTQYCRKLGVGVITQLQDVWIFADHVEIDDRVIDEVDELDAFARADGFESWDDFIPFFREFYGLPWNGDLIRWRVDRA
ncbi:ASCH domain-containing protein [Hydrocarboniphaga effusa]|uniref:ASCH domain-containing protein n=1 Tax=Hydrocarboniphaga effusa TaxID=243629 RepID=UPI003BA93480